MRNHYYNGSRGGEIPHGTQIDTAVILPNSPYYPLISQYRMSNQQQNIAIAPAHELFGFIGRHVVAPSLILRRTYPNGNCYLVEEYKCPSDLGSVSDGVVLKRAGDAAIQSTPHQKMTFVGNSEAVAIKTDDECHRDGATEDAGSVDGDRKPAARASTTVASSKSTSKVTDCHCCICNYGHVCCHAADFALSFNLRMQRTLWQRQIMCQKLRLCLSRQPGSVL